LLAIFYGLFSIYRVDWLPDKQLAPIPQNKNKNLSNLMPSKLILFDGKIPSP
jgi:hypothetical protein